MFIYFCTGNCMFLQTVFITFQSKAECCLECLSLSAAKYIGWFTYCMMIKKYLIIGSFILYICINIYIYKRIYIYSSTHTQRQVMRPHTQTRYKCGKCLMILVRQNNEPKYGYFVGRNSSIAMAFHVTRTSDICRTSSSALK